MLRSAVRVVGLTGALFSSSVFALGLGDMKLFSAINEPLNAEIKLLKVGDLNTTQVLVKLASLQDFERANVEREFFLTGMRYEVVLDGRGGGVVKVTTNEPVREPYLNFLLEAKWPSGRLVREYTLLLDLPAFTSTSSAQSAAMQAPQAEVAPPPAETFPIEEPAADFDAPAEPVPAPAPAPRIAEPEPRPVFREEPRVEPREDSYRTQRADTLWKIAQQVRPSDRVSVNQTMIALQRDNQHAFINGNINRLKVGQVLRLPDEQRVLDIANSQARLEVARQMQEWRSADDEIRQIDARAGAVQPASAASTDSRGTLKLSTAAGAGINGDADGTADADVMALNARLTDVMAQLSSASNENDNLNSRVQELLTEMEDLKNKLELRNSQLAQLQAQGLLDDADLELDSTPDAAVTPEEPQLSPEAADTQQMASAADYDSSPDTPVNEELNAAAEAVEPAEEVRPTAPRTLAAPEPTWYEKLMQPLWLGVLAVVGLLAGLFFWRRKRANDEFDYSSEGAADELKPSIAATEPTFAAMPEVSEEEAPQDEAQSSDSSAIEAEMGDPIAEADIYVAYGRYPQAVELLSRAIEQEPERTDLVAKLVEVHSAAGDREAAAEQLAKLESMGSGDGFVADSDADGFNPSANDDAPDVMEEFQDTLPEEDSMKFSEEFENADKPVDETLIASILDGDDEESESTESPVAEPVAEMAEFEAAELDADIGSEDDGLSFDEDFDLELDLDENEDGHRDIDPSDVREAFAEGNDLLDSNFESHEAVATVDQGELESGNDELLLDDAGDFSASSDDLDELAEIELDLDDELDIESELGSLDVSIEDESANSPGIVSGELEDLEMELENTALDGDDDAQRAADIAMLESDETATKLDLARAYIDMGDTEGARDILDEVLDEGSALDKQQAKELLDRIA